MAGIKVLVHGALGKMGQAVVGGLAQQPSIEVVAAVDVAAATDRQTLSTMGPDIPLARTVEPLLESVAPDVLVDFSHADATLPAVRAASRSGVNFVVGTTGISEDAVAEMTALAAEHGVGGVVAPNFALGAVLLLHLAKRASPFFEYAEIIETHHETKIDAPSGTAATTARLMVEARGGPFKRNVAEKETMAGTRGGQHGGVTVHSLRLPGTMAHHEVVFGIAGQTLTIRHDTINRECYLPGIIMAVRHVMDHQGLVYGLDRLMGL